MVSESASPGCVSDHTNSTAPVAILLVLEYLQDLVRADKGVKYDDPLRSKIIVVEGMTPEYRGGNTVIVNVSHLGALERIDSKFCLVSPIGSMRSMKWNDQKLFTYWYSNVRENRSAPAVIVNGKI